MSAEVYGERYLYNHYVLHLDQASCTGFFLQWDPEASILTQSNTGEYTTIKGHCKFTTPSLLVVFVAISLVNFAIWWVVCKGKGRSVRSLDAAQLEKPPYQAIRLCDCWGLNGRAVLETIFCPFYMWGETMVRSGTMPLPVVALVGVIHFVAERFISGVYLVFCLFRCLGRVSLRNKLGHEAPAASICAAICRMISDCTAICCCNCCSIAQEAEYLELKANDGQPAADNVNLQQQLHTNTPKAV